MFDLSFGTYKLPSKGFTNTLRIFILSLSFHARGERERSPHYQKLYSRVPHIWGNRKGQPAEVQWQGLALGEPPA